MDSDEKRDFPRMQINCGLEFSIEGENTLFNADAVNLSATGILFQTTHPLKVGDRIRIKVPSDAPTSIFRALVEIIRIDQGEGSNINVAGHVVEAMND